MKFMNIYLIIVCDLGSRLSQNTSFNIILDCSYHLSVVIDHLSPVFHFADANSRKVKYQILFVSDKYLDEYY